MKPVLASVPALCLSLLVACGPSISGGTGDDDDDDTPGGQVDAGGSCTPSAEVCNNNNDEDCDGLVDCDDADCEQFCASCGEIEHPEASLALPDGDGVSYESSISFTQFGAGQTLQNIQHFRGVFVNMEHSWLRDLQMELTCPDGKKVVLHNFGGRTGGEVFMGMPNDTDGTNPTPGTGLEYTWSPQATTAPMLQYVNGGGQTHPLPAGEYRSFDPMNNLLGCPLNGTWTLKVTDDWPIDNGFIFSWGLRFDPAIVSDCANWPPIG